jgi:ABC transporter substrate binding protein
MSGQTRRACLQGGAVLVGLGLLAGCGLDQTTGPAPAKVRRIGVLGEAPSDHGDALLEARRDLGYIEGQTIASEYRWARGDVDRFRVLTADLVRLDVDCIVTGGIPASSLAKPATTTIPMVVALHNFDAVEAGLVANIARPAGSITGTAGSPASGGSRSGPRSSRRPSRRAGGSPCSPMRSSPASAASSTGSTRRPTGRI